MSQKNVRNNSKTKSVTLRYGDGLNKAVQLLPGEIKPIPAEMSRKLLQAYLANFNFIEVVDNSEPVKENKDVEKLNNVPEQDSESGQDNSTKTPADDDATQTGDSSEILSTEGDSDVSADQGETPNDSDKSEGELEGEKDENKSNSDTESSDVQKDEDESEDESKDAPNNTTTYTEKQLTKLSAEEVKEIAKSLGIEVAEDSTKKALIPVILNKQDENN